MDIWLPASRLVDSSYAVWAEDYDGDGLYDCGFAVVRKSSVCVARGRLSKCVAGPSSMIVTRRPIAVDGWSRAMGGVIVCSIQRRRASVDGIIRDGET